MTRLTGFSGRAGVLVLCRGWRISKKPSARDGDINHWLFNQHGKYVGASLLSGKTWNLSRGARLIVYSPYTQMSLDDRLGAPGTVTWCKNWEEVIEELKKFHKGNPKVAVLPDGTSGIPESYLSRLEK